MGSPSTWKEKCLAALDQQEALEKKVAAQSDLLRRLVIFLSAAAATLDPELDAALGHLKDKLKGASGSVVHDQMLRVERIVRQFEDKRLNYHQQNIQAVIGIINNLTQLSLPHDFLTELGKLKRQFSRSDFSLPLIPEQLNALARVHAQAMVLSKEPDVSVWQRLKGASRIRFEEQGGRSDNRSVADKTDATTPPEFEVSVSPPSDSLIAQNNISEQDLDQASWGAVRSDIKIMLDETLDAFNTDEQSSPTWQSAKIRLQGNIDWHQLVETLADFRGLLAEREERVHHGISDYLNQVNEELHEICERLGLSAEVEHSHELAVNTLGEAVTEQVQQMQSMVEDGTDLESLKTDISQQINVISSALNEFRKRSEEVRPISDELQELIKKVKSIELESERTRQLLAQEQYRASYDALTELPNRNSYNNRVILEWNRFKRYGRPLSIAVCDVDHFKGFNDTYGHQIGDRILRLIAKSLFKRLRAVDFVARYGGEEFVVLLPETALDDAFKVIDSARSTIGSATFRFKDEPVNITFSCGVTEFNKGDTVETAFARADNGLYQAKEAGRNQTICVKADKKPS